MNEVCTRLVLLGRVMRGEERRAEEEAPRRPESDQGDSEPPGQHEALPQSHFKLCCVAHYRSAQSKSVRAKYRVTHKETVTYL